MKPVLTHMKNRADSVKELFSLALRKGEFAFMYLGYSGVILRTVDSTVAFDVADLLTGDEIRALESLNLLLFTHGHGDHYNPMETLDIFRETGARIVAEPNVAEDLMGKIPSEKLTAASPRVTYRIGDFEITVVKGVHRGPINLYQVKIAGTSIFHGGDSGYVSVKDFPSDLAFIPTGVPSPTASPMDALRMTLELKPKVAVAIHGSSAQNREFEKSVQQKMPELKVIIPKPYKPKKIVF